MRAMKCLGRSWQVQAAHGKLCRRTRYRTLIDRFCAMKQLLLSVLGRFAFTIDGQEVTDFPTDKSRALLAYLALESDRSHPRERTGRPALAGRF